MTALKQRVSAIPTDLADLPPPESGGIQPWVRRWDCMLGLGLPDDGDKAESEIANRIQRWSRHLGDDPNTQAAFREATFAAVISDHDQTIQSECWSLWSVSHGRKSASGWVGNHTRRG